MSTPSYLKMGALFSSLKDISRTNFALKKKRTILRHRTLYALFSAQGNPDPDTPLPPDQDKGIRGLVA